MTLALVSVCAFLLGGVNPAYLFTRWKKGVDIRNCGTGNAGATNAMFTLGLKTALIVMLLDVCKAALCVTAARLLFPRNVYAGPVAGLSCMLGHIFPVWLKFRGGKGTACMCGIILALTPALVLPLLLVAFLLGLLTNRASLLPLATAMLYSPSYYLWTGNRSVALLLCVMIPMLLWSHRKNLFGRLQETPFRTMLFHHNLDRCVERKGPDSRS